MVATVVHEVLNAVQQFILSVHVTEFLVGFILVRNSRCSVGLQLNHIVTLLEVLELSFGLSEFTVDLFKTCVDELLCSEGDLVLIVVCLTVVVNGKLVEKVNGTLRYRVYNRKLGDCCSLRSLTYAKLANELVCSHCRRYNCNHFDLAIGKNVCSVSIECNRTRAGCETGWQTCKFA